jgi:MerR family transcriptional regulator, copper efflux regulator
MTQTVQIKRRALVRVGKLAKLTGKTVRALHLYEELGLLRPERRTDGGFRLYAATAKERIDWIAKLQEMGFSLPEIRDFLSTWEQSANGPAAMEKVRAVFETKLAETRAALVKMAALERDLTDSLEYLKSCQACEPAHAPTECAHCDLHGHDGDPPPLVAGIHQT